MKKIFNLIVLLAGVISFTSCGDDDATYTPVTPLEVANADVFFSAAGGTGSIVVDATGTVTAETTSPWLTVSVSGNTVNLTAQENPSRDGRSAKIVLKANGATTNVTATQKGNVFSLDGGGSYKVTTSDASTLTINVTSSSPVKLQSLTDWVTATYSEENSAITVNLAANTTPEERVGRVAMEAGGLKDTLVFTQTAFLFEIQGGNSYTVDGDASTLTINVNASSTVTVQSLASWITARWNATNKQITLTIAANNTTDKRVGEVVVKSGNVQETLTITQSKPTGNFDLQGDYMLLFTDKDDGELYYFDATIVNEGNQWAMLLPDLDFSLPLTNVQNGKNAKIALSGGSYIGDYAGYYCHTVMWDTNLGYITWSTSVTYPAAFQYMEDEEGGFYLGIFKDNGSWSGYTVDGLMIYACSDTPITADNRVGYVAAMINPYLVKFDETPSMISKRVQPKKSIKKKVLGPKPIPFK